MYRRSHIFVTSRPECSGLGLVDQGPSLSAKVTDVATTVRQALQKSNCISLDVRAFLSRQYFHLHEFVELVPDVLDQLVTVPCVKPVQNPPLIEFSLSPRRITLSTVRFSYAFVALRRPTQICTKAGLIVSEDWRGNRQGFFDCLLECRGIDDITAHSVFLSLKQSEPTPGKLDHMSG